MSAVQLTEDEFEDRFHPQTKDGELFTFDEVRALPAERVWTIVDGDDGNLYALPGFHVVNRQGYVTSEVPWTEEIETAEWAIFADDDEDEPDEA